MKFSNTTPVALSLRGATAAVLALTLAACGPDSPPPPKVGAKAAGPPAQSAPQPEARATPPATSTAPQAGADAGLATRVKNALNAERLLREDGIDVDARDGVVTLFGTVESRMKLEMATTVAAAVEGVKSVVNKLVVIAGS